MSDAQPPFRNIIHTDDDDGDTASQRSISLSSPPVSARNSIINNVDDDAYAHDTMIPTTDKRASKPYTVDTDVSSEVDDMSLFNHESPDTSAAPSVFEDPKAVTSYPPPAMDTESLAESFASGSSRKARPESMLVLPQTGKLVLGIALIDFNHLVGPRIEWSKGEIFQDEEVAKIIPFLALPDGAHLSAEDYSYFHLVPSVPNPTTIFGISCNQQIAASALLVKMPDVTRSTVQKAVVVLASKPVFGPIRDKLGVVTTALFHQRDFRETQILDDFETALEPSLRGQLTESGLYMGTNLRELVHTFRQRTLILVKALILQKRIMFYGHPVERLCTYQYSLISLLPGLLQSLDDCGSPPLANRAPTLTRPTSLRTSDHKSMLAYTGLPLDIFGKDSFFQPYLPLQQLDILKETKSWLCGSTNSIVTQQSNIDLLVNTETGAFEFRDLKLERSAGLTAADRKWMDDIVTDVNDGWDEENPIRSGGIQFKGSEDYLRTKFEEYISAALSSVRYKDFVARSEDTGVLITRGTGGDSTSTEDFNPLWIAEFKNTNAYEVWDRTTDPLLFDIVEPRHPCNEKVSVVTDIGLRLQEGIQELKLEQQLAPAREAVARTVAAGSANFFKAVEGVKGRWMQRSPSNDGGITTPPVTITKADLEPETPPVVTAKPLMLSKHASVEASPRTAFSSWGSGFGAFVSEKATRFSLSRGNTQVAEAPRTPTTPKAVSASPVVLSSSPSPVVLSSSPSPVVLSSSPSPVVLSSSPSPVVLSSSPSPMVSTPNFVAQQSAELDAIHDHNSSTPGMAL